MGGARGYGKYASFFEQNGLVLDNVWLVTLKLLWYLMVKWFSELVPEVVACAHSAADLNYRWRTENATVVSSSCTFMLL